MSDRGKPTGARAAKRGIWFFMRTVMLACLLVALCYFAYETAKRMSNLYIITTEGMQLRAECILKNTENDELNDYFSEAFLLRDSAMETSRYKNYTVSNYDYRIQVEGIAVWPWSKAATVTVVERMVSMSGSIHEDLKPTDAPKDAEYPLPEWESGRYRLYFTSRNGRWFVYQMTLLDSAPSAAPLRTPDMNMTPQPAVTPTPTPLPSATPTAKAQGNDRTPVPATPPPTATPAPAITAPE